MGSCPLLTPPAGGWILDSRINKAILNAQLLQQKINLNPDLKRTKKPSAQDRMPSAQDTRPSARQNQQLIPNSYAKI